VEAYPGAIEANPKVVEDHPSTMEPLKGFILEQWRLTLEH
jgi:hypothetical protein